MGLPKCNLDPLLLLKWLGFLVDSEDQSFKVGESKMAKLKQLLEETIARPDTSPRKVAELAGKILAVSPAVLPAALYSRSFYAALKGKSSWDEVFPTPGAVKEAAEFWLHNLERFNGRKWWPQPVTVRATVDASGVGYGGTVAVGRKSPVKITGTFSPEQAAQSSTAREIWGYAAALEAAFKNFPEELKEAAVLLEGDNQGAISAINHLRSPVEEINGVLRRIFQLCSDNGFDVVAKWIPRDNLSDADALLRAPDHSDWGLSDEELRKVLKHFGVQPTLDLFASDVHHVADRFVSKFFTPGCTAVDATKQN
jgi:hypothetical protein